MEKFLGCLFLAVYIPLVVAQGSEAYECVPKVMMVDEIEYDEVLQCHHVYREQCIESYVTRFKPHMSEECKQQFRKSCMIVYDPVPIKVPYQFCPLDHKCFNLTKVTVKDVPREMCSMSTGKKCADKSVLLPTLQAEEKCLEVPKEICVMVRKNPHTVKRPVIKTWCPNLDHENIRDCGDVLKVVGKAMYKMQNHEFSIGPDPNKTSLFCDEDGWTVIQSRGQFGNSPNYFVRPWTAFTSGFGVSGKEFWLGLDKMYNLTNGKNYALRITLEDVNGVVDHGIWKEFRITEPEKFTLHVDGYQGGLGGDSFAYQSGFFFSTLDQENDAWPQGHCVRRFRGAWWHGACHHSNLNGINYFTDMMESYADGIVYQDFRGYKHSMKSAKMAIKELDY